MLSQSLVIRRNECVFVSTKSLTEGIMNLFVFIFSRSEQTENVKANDRLLCLLQTWFQAESIHRVCVCVNTLCLI